MTILWNRMVLFFASLCVLISTMGCSKSMDYIDFSKTQDVMQVEKNQEKEQRPLVIAVASVISPKETINYYRLIAQHISEVTGYPTVLIQRKTYAEINMLLSNGEADMAFLSTGSYISYRGLNEIELLAMTELENESIYETDIIVHKDSDIYSLADLEGRTFAFTDPLSFSGHLVIENVLHQQNTTSERYFKRYFYTYNHDKSLWAVANHIADAASVDSQIYQYAVIHKPEMTDQIRIIAALNPAPTGPVVVRQSLPAEQKEQLRETFLHMNQEPEVADAMQKLMIDRFVSPQPELYIPLKKIYDRISVYYEKNS